MKTPDEPENTEYEQITDQNHVLRPRIDEIRRRVYNDDQWTDWSTWFKAITAQTIEECTSSPYPPIVEWEFRKPKEKQTMQTTNNTDLKLLSRPPLLFPGELENAGIFLESHWPTPKVILNEPGARFVLSYIENYAEHAAPIFIDVYIYQKDDGKQSLVFADKITTKHNTYGSCDIMVFLDTINNGRSDHPWRIAMFGMLALGLFQFKFTPEIETIT